MARAKAAAGAAGESRISRTIFGVPARFMVPRLVFIAAVVVLTAFGLLMVYSASSVLALTSPYFDGNPAYFLQHQAVAAAIGGIAVVALAFIDYRVWLGRLVYVIFAATVIALALVFSPMAGHDAYGATRWILIAGFTFQPTEFAKAAVILIAAAVAERYYEQQVISFKRFLVCLAVGCGSILALVLLQPDKGSFAIMSVTLFAMGYLAGMPAKWLLGIAGVAAIAFVFLAFRDEYSLSRIRMTLDPFQDAGGEGYQLVQGFYAFGSGGLFGVGLGHSSQKYSYLPMAYNDFIFAIVGEELGLLGTLGTLAVFAALVWAGYRIAEHASDLAGRLIAAGATTLIWVQLMVNILGVLGLIPLTGKPVPFLSYGGSTILGCLILAGLVISVSVHTTLPETPYDERRAKLVDAADRRDFGLSFAGEAHTRSETLAAKARSEAAPTGDKPFLRVVDGSGGGAAKPAKEKPQAAGAKAKAKGRVSTDAEGRTRIDLGPSAADRLRRETSAVKSNAAVKAPEMKRGRRDDSRS